MQREKQVKVYGYMRVSGRGQVEGDGFERQGIAIRKHAAEKGMEVVEMFREEGVSGGSEWEVRPAWLRMVEKMGRMGVRVIVIERLDRVARDLLVQEHIIQDLQKRGVLLVSTEEEDLCSNDPTRRLMRQIMGAIAEYDKAMVVMKLRGARERVKGRSGKCEGRKGYGERAGEREVLGQMREWWREGANGSEIVRRCEARGWKARGGGKWQVRVVLRLVKG